MDISPRNVCSDFKYSATKISMWIEGQYSPVKGQAQDGQKDDVAAFLALLQACAKSRDSCRGAQIHDHILRRGLLDQCSDALISMYARCGALTKAKQLFNMHGSDDIFAWNALIARFVQMGHHQSALNYYDMMQHRGLSPNAMTFACILKSCGSQKALVKGEQIHDEIAKQGLLGNNVVLGNALVTMYAKSGALARARLVLDELPVRNVVSWNALISGYVEHGEAEESLRCFEQMQGEGLRPNAVTFTCVLKACGSMQSIDKGERVHEEIAKQGLLVDDVVLGTALVAMYAKCGVFVKARLVLEELHIRDVIVWTALITGYAEYGEISEAFNCFELMKSEGLYPDAYSWTAVIAGYAERGENAQALYCFEQMRRNGIPPDAVTYACVLKACGSMGAAGKGREIHDEISQQGHLQNSLVLGTALVDMYAKCGALTKAQEVLEEIPVRDVVSWTALITGLMQQGKGTEALNCFDHMQHEGLSPDAATFSCILSACSRSGLVEAAQTHFVNMSLKHGMKPGLRHYTGMIDIFGRLGQLDKAFQLTDKISSFDIKFWSALLGACQKLGDVNVGRWVFDQAVKVNKSDAAIYVSLANIYAAVGMHKDAGSVGVARTKESMKEVSPELAGELWVA